MTVTLISPDAWPALRRQSIGSSEAAAACEEDPRCSPAELVLRKRGLMDEPRLEGLQYIEAGQWLQPSIIGWCAHRLGLKLIDLRDQDIVERLLTSSGDTEVIGWVDRAGGPPEPMCRSKAHPWMTATIDALAYDVEGRIAIIEAKNVGAYLSAEWDSGAEQAPARARIQIAHQMAVVPAATVGILTGLVGGNSPRDLVSDRDQMKGLIDLVVALERRVWSYVTRHGKTLGEIIPPYDGTASHIRALRALHPKDSGETVRLPRQMETMHIQLELAKRDRRLADEKVKELSQAIEAQLAGATFGELPDIGTYSNHWQHRGEHLVPACDFPVLRFKRAKSRNSPAANLENRS